MEDTQGGCKLPFHFPFEPILFLYLNKPGTGEKNQSCLSRFVSNDEVSVLDTPPFPFPPFFVNFGRNQEMHAVGTAVLPIGTAVPPNRFSVAKITGDPGITPILWEQPSRKRSRRYPHFDLTKAAFRPFIIRNLTGIASKQAHLISPGIQQVRSACIKCKRAAFFK